MLKKFTKSQQQLIVGNQGKEINRKENYQQEKTKFIYNDLRKTIK